MRNKVAFYLVGQGPYREPRLIELQYLRLERYMFALSNRLNTDFFLEETYIDINFRRNITFDNLPNLRRLIQDIEIKKFEAILIDLPIGIAFNPCEYMPIIDTLKSTGVKVYNCFYDDEDALEEKLVEKFGESVRKVPLPEDCEEIISLFPALAGSIIIEVFYDKRNLFDDKQLDKIEEIASRLQSQNPYISYELPWLGDRRLKMCYDLMYAETEQRRLVEQLYIIGPNVKGLLIDEGLLNERSRNQIELEFAEQRLKKLGFEKANLEKGIIYTLELEKYIIFADIRTVGKIRFFVYQKDLITNDNKNLNYQSAIKTFYILDNWVKDIIEKFENRTKEFK